VTQQEIEQINETLNNIQREINSLQSQVDSIKLSLAADSKQPKVKLEKQQIPEPQIPSVTLQEKHQDKTEPKDFEKTFGKSWMGAIASVLIFVSIIMFATLLIPYMSDVLKLTAMFVVSIAVTAFGLYKLKSNAKSPFYLSLAGCGIGAVYISLLMSNIYFKIVNDTGLFLLILVWAVLVCIVNRGNSVLFHVIGQLGITIAIITGAYLCVNTKDNTKFLLLVAFFAVSSLIFFFSNIRQTPNYKIVDHGFNTFDIFWIICGYILLKDYALVGIIGIAYIVGMICTLILQSKNNISFGILTTIYGIEAYGFILITGCGYGTVTDILGILLGIAMLCIAEYKIRKPLDVGRCIIQVAFIIMISDRAADISVNEKMYIYITLAFIFMVLGFVRKDLVYKFAGLCNIACVVFGSEYDKALIEVLCLVFFGVLFYLLVRLKEQYNCPFKIVSYLGLIFSIAGFSEILETALDYEFSRTILFAIITFLNLIAIKTIGMVNFKTLEFEKSSGIVLNIINTIMMICGLVMINFSKDDVCLIIIIITTLAAFSVNSVNFMRKYNNNIIAGIYVGIKYTGLLVTILNAINAPSVIVSVACLLLAVVCILIGFKLLIKSIRIYGLSLSILSVAKLSLLDINYDNLAGRAVGFFVCGVLCFGISLVYNMIDKKMGRDVET
jgi:hypothetical protein